MKLIVLILCLLSFTSFAEIDSLSIQDKTVLEIVNGKEIFQAQSDWWDKYSSGLIAAFTVIISLGISVWQARKTTKATRANSISEARIQWIQELRPLMSKLITQAYELNNEVNELVKLFDVSKKLAKKDLSESERRKLTERTSRLEILHYEIVNTLYSIKLLLNKSKKEHDDFISLTESFISETGEKTKDENSKMTVTLDEISDSASVILKNAWEQAKSEKG